MLYLSDVAGSWLRFYTLHNVESGLFVLLIFAIDKCFRPATRFRYYLMVLALAKFLMPPLFSAPLHISKAAPAMLLLQPLEVVGSGAGGEVLTLPIVAFLVWLASVCLIWAFVVRQNLKLRMLLKTAQKISGHEKILHSIKLPNGLDVYCSKLVATPIIRGSLKAKLYLPATYESWPSQQLRSIIAHEVAHLRGRDNWVLGLQTLAIVLFWANPLVWLLHKRLLHLRELHCDEIAIAQTGVDPVAYSKYLYSFLDNINSNPLLAVTGVHFAQNKKALLERFRHLLSLGDGKIATGSLSHYIVLVLAGLLFVPFSCQYISVTMAPEQISNSVAQADGRIFVAYDKGPEPIGGFTAIQEKLHYPEIARQAGIEGRVIVNVLVSETGEVEDVRVLKSLGKSGCDEAAIAAVRAVKWKPASQAGRPVKVWVGIPVIFKLDAK